MMNGGGPQQYHQQQSPQQQFPQQYQQQGQAPQQQHQQGMMVQQQQGQGYMAASCNPVQVLLLLLVCVVSDCFTLL